MRKILTVRSKIILIKLLKTINLKRRNKFKDWKCSLYFNIACKKTQLKLTKCFFKNMFIVVNDSRSSAPCQSQTGSHTLQSITRDCSIKRLLSALYFNRIQIV